MKITRNVLFFRQKIVSFWWVICQTLCSRSFDAILLHISLLEEGVFWLTLWRWTCQIQNANVIRWNVFRLWEWEQFEWRGQGRNPTFGRVKAVTKKEEDLEWMFVQKKWTMSYDVSGSFILEGRLWHIRSTSRINGRSNAHHESGQQHAIHASLCHTPQTVGDF